MDGLTFDQESALMLRERREFFERQDRMYDNMCRRQRARQSPAAPELASRGTPARLLAAAPTDPAAVPRIPTAASGLLGRRRPAPTPQADIVAQEQRTARRKRRQCRDRDEAVAEVMSVKSARKGEVYVTLPTQKRVTATLAAYNDETGWAVALYEAAGDAGAIALPIGLFSAGAQADVRRHSVQIQAAASTAEGLHGLHQPSHFKPAEYAVRAGAEGGPRRALVIEGEPASGRGAEADAGTEVMVRPSLQGFTCDGAMRTTLTERVLRNDSQPRRVFYLLADAVGPRGGCLAEQMARHHNTVAGKRSAWLLGTDGVFDQRLSRLRVVRDTLFGDGVVRGYGNLWQRHRSKSSLLAALRQPLDSCKVAARMARCLRRVVGLPAQMDSGHFVACNGQAELDPSAGALVRCVCGLRQNGRAYSAAGLNGNHKLCGRKRKAGGL